MGYIRHQAIVVTGADYSDLGGRNTTGEARDKALELGLLCSEIVKGGVNRYTSFLIAPDGSKEGWATSHEFDEKRKQWIDWAKKLNRVDWASLTFGGDDAHQAGLDDWNCKGDDN